MRKLGYLLCLLLLLSGCNKNKTNYRLDYTEKYENYMELIIDNSKQVSSNIPFDYQFNMYEVQGQYAYEVAILNPKVAMSNIQMIAVNIEEISELTIAPCTGIFDEQVYNMIPNQADFNKGYFGGIGVNGLTKKDKFALNCLVVYKDKNQNDNYVYFIIQADYKDFEKKEEVDNGQES